MLKAYIRYGAVTTKVRAMYGRLLTPSDWTRLVGLKTLSDISAYLRSTPAWGAAMTALPAGELTPQVFFDVLNDGVKAEYEKLYHFGSDTDRRLLEYAVYRAEYHAILSALVRLGSGGHSKLDLGAENAPLAEKSKMNLSFIQSSASFEELLADTESTVYGDVLRRLPRGQNGLPDFAGASAVLENRYYSATYDYLKEQGDEVSKKLQDRLGLEADLLNICGVLRLHRSFPASLPEMKDLLIPIRGQLADSLLNALIAAPDEAAALKLLQGTPWGKYFPPEGSPNLELLSERAMEAFCRKLIVTGSVGAYFPQVYLTLREIERAKLIRVITAVYYGIDPATVL